MTDEEYGPLMRAGRLYITYHKVAAMWSLPLWLSALFIIAKKGLRRDVRFFAGFLRARPWADSTILPRRFASFLAASIALFVFCRPFPVRGSQNRLNVGGHNQCGRPSPFSLLCDRRA